MNDSYNPLHLVGSYGAFGSVTRERYEVVLEGTQDEQLSEHTRWREYEFKGKPGDPKRRPRQWAPYHLRLDWLMWFLPLRVVVTPSAIFKRGYPAWFLRLVEKLLEGDRATLALLRTNPFPRGLPAFVRASFYRYRLENPAARKQTGAHWQRHYVGEYLPAMTREQLAEPRASSS